MVNMFVILCILILSSSTVFAQYHSFGRNKIQYTKFDWQVMSTEHFEIYYNAEMEHLALIGAQEAEESYDVLKNKYNHTLNYKVPLIFYSAHLYFQQTNVIPNFLPEGIGGFFEFFKGRVVIPSDGSITRFKRVIRHELNHVFMRGKVTRVNKNHKVFNPRFPPFWFTEGLAEYWSGKSDTQAEMVIRDAVLNNYIVPAVRLYTIAGTYLVYKEGENLLSFISERYGDEKILLMMENIWVYPRFHQVIEYVLGISYQELSKQWIYSLQKKYYPLLEEKDKPQMASSIVDQKGFNSKPAVYTDKDGTKNIIYVSNKKGYTGIYQKPFDSKTNTVSEEIIVGEKSSDFEKFHLFRSSIDVNENRILTFVTKSGETDVIHRLNLDNNELLPALSFKELVTISSPSWSPDGNKIAFTGLSRMGFNDIYIFDIPNNYLQKLTNDDYDDRDPSWSPDSKYIAFSSDRTMMGSRGKYNLFKIDVQNLNIRYLTYGDFNDRAPKFSNDGKIVFFSDRGGMNNIWLLKDTMSKDTYNLNSVSQESVTDDHKIINNLKDYHAVRVTNFTTSAMDPVWSDENSLVFTAFEDFSYKIMKLPKFQTFDTSIEKQNMKFSRVELWKHRGYEKDITKISKKYKSGYTLDIAQSQVTQDPIFGTTGGAALALSDILGNNQYYIVIYNNARTSGDLLNSFNVSVTKISLAGRTNIAYGGFRLNNRLFNLHEGFFDEERIGGFLSVSHPLSFFQRIEASTSLSYSQKDRFNNDKTKSWLAVNSIRYVKDNSLWGSSGPMDGQRISVSVAYTNDIRFSNLNYYSVVADYRKYFRLSNNTTYATRFMYMHSEGNPDREIQRFYIGGSWTLRLYPRFRVWGTRAYVINNEYRFPFIDQMGVKFPFGAIGFRRIRGALFFDVGNVYNGELSINKWEETKGSYGIGFRMNLGGFLVLRYDIGKRTTLRKWPDTTYRQFFFGWDF